MANYYATARTNYFKVKDTDLFKKWLKEFNSIDVEVVPEKNGKFAILFGEDGIPSHRWNDETQDDDDIDFTDELSKHLVEGEVAIIMSVGAEKLRYVSGYATAVNSKGDTVEISLDDIYEKASLALNTKNISRAEY